MSLRTSKLFLFVLVAVTASGPLAMQMFLPALPAIQRGFAVEVGTAQLAFSLSMLSMAISTLAYGPLSDRFGRRPVLIAGMMLFFGGSVLAAVAPSIEVLIAARVVQAAGGAAGVVLARSIVRDVYGHDGAARMISYLIMAMVAAPMIAPTLGGIVTDLAGWRSVFAVVAAVGLVIVALVFWRAPETHGHAARAAGRGSLWTGMAHLLRTPAFLGYALASSFSMAIFFAFLAAAPYLMVNTLARTASEYGLYFAPVAAAFIVGTFISTRLLDRYGIDRLILLGGVATLGLALLAALVLFLLPLTPLLLFVPMGVLSVVQGLVVPNCQAGAINVDPRYAGAASGLTGFLQMAISAAANQLVGSLNDGSVDVMLAVVVGGAVLSLATFMLAWRRAPDAAVAERGG